MKALIAILAVAALDAGHGADRDLDLSEPHFPVVQCSVTLPQDFTASDPTIIVTYSNTSDRCPAYELVPIRKMDRLVLGPGVSFDGADTMPIDPDLEFVPRGTLEIPPEAAVSIAYRIRDQYRMPEEWSRMLVRPTSRYLLELPWFEFDASGRETSRGSDRVRSYDRFVSRAWEEPRNRERIRADIRRYAEMKANGVPMRPKIGDEVSPTGVVERLPGVEIVDGMVRYPPRPSAATNAPSASPAPPRRRPSPPSHPPPRPFRRAFAPSPPCSPASPSCPSARSPGSSCGGGSRTHEERLHRSAPLPTIGSHPPRVFQPSEMAT